MAVTLWQAKEEFSMTTLNQRVNETNTDISTLSDSVQDIVSQGLTRALKYGATDGENGMFDKLTATPSGTAPLRYNGVFKATQVYGTYFSDAADYAEAYDVVGDIEAGELIVVDEKGRFVRNTIKNNPCVIGIASTNFASCIGLDPQHNGSDIPVALMGRVPVKCVGNIKAGDYLVGSDVYGRVEKADNNAPRGSIVAMALENSNGKDSIMAMVVRM